MVKHVLKNCADDLAFFAKFQDKGLMERLDAVANRPFARVRYEDAIKMLQAEISKDPSKWQYPDVRISKPRAAPVPTPLISNARGVR